MNIGVEYLIVGVGLINIRQTEVDGIQIETGENGMDGVRTDDLQLAKSPDPFHKPSQIINDYKSCVRESLPKNILESRLREFLDHFEEDMLIQSEYDTLSLVNELQGLEKQYIELRDKMSFVPFVESLWRRINTHNQNENLFNNDKKVLNLLSATTLTKLSSIKNRTNYASTIDLLAYTRIVQNHIKILRSAERNDAIHESHRHFAQTLQNKINLANRFIQSQILADIKRNFIDLDENIHMLIFKNIGHQVMIREEQQKKALLKQKILFWIQVIGPLVVCLGTAAAVVFAGGTVSETMIKKGLGLLASSSGIYHTIPLQIS